MRYVYKHEIQTMIPLKRIVFLVRPELISKSQRILKRRGWESKNNYATSHRCERNHEFESGLKLRFKMILTLYALRIQTWDSDYHSIKNYIFKVIKMVYYIL